MATIRSFLQLNSSLLSVVLSRLGRVRLHLQVKKIKEYMYLVPLCQSRLLPGKCEITVLHITKQLKNGHILHFGIVQKIVINKKSVGRKQKGSFRDMVMAWLWVGQFTQIIQGPQTVVGTTLVKK